MDARGCRDKVHSEKTERHEWHIHSSWIEPSLRSSTSQPYLEVGLEEEGSQQHLCPYGSSGGPVSDGRGCPAPPAVEGHTAHKHTYWVGGWMCATLSADLVLVQSSVYSVSCLVMCLVDDDLLAQGCFGLVKPRPDSVQRRRQRTVQLQMPVQELRGSRQCKNVTRILNHRLKSGPFRLWIKQCLPMAPARTCHKSNFSFTHVFAF